MNTGKHLGFAALLDMLVACWSILVSLVSELLERARDRAHGRAPVIVVDVQQTNNSRKDAA